MTTQSERAGLWSEELVRSVATGALAGFLAGFIAGGIGSRVAMRVVAITAGDADQGALTDFEARVGEITAGGTIFLLLAGGLVGVLGGLIYLAVRRWLADAGPLRGLTFGTLLLAMLGSSIIRSDNPDFHRFGAAPLNMAMFAGIFVVFGVLVAPLFDLIERAEKRWRVSGGSAGLGAGVAQVFGLLLLVGGVLSVPIVARGVALILVPYVLIALPLAYAAGRALPGRRGGGFERLSDLRGRPPALVTAVAVLALPVVVGLTLDVKAMVDIFQV